MKLLDSATSGGDPVTITQRNNLSQIQAGKLFRKGDPRLHMDGPYGGKNTHYWVNEKVTTPTGTPTTDPQALYNLLIGSNITKAMALNLVRTKTGQTTWSPGQPSKHTAAQLNDMPINSLVGIAKQLGYTPDPKNHPHDSSWYRSWILAHES
jgi:hypothetical protein